MYRIVIKYKNLYFIFYQDKLDIDKICCQLQDYIFENICDMNIDKYIRFMIGFTINVTYATKYSYNNILDRSEW